VVRLSKTASSSSIACDLRCRNDVFRAIEEIGSFDAVVHLAARAHDVRCASERQLFEANCDATENLVDALANIQRLKTLKFVFASSVAVAGYLEVGSWRSDGPVSAYGRSKLAAEKLLAGRPFGSLHLMRFAPIFDSTHLGDVRKRVFLPLLPFKVLIDPTPLHFLCSLPMAIHSVREALLAPFGSSSVSTISDARPVSQRILASWFSGSAVHCSATSFRALASICSLIPLVGQSLSFTLLKFAVGHAADDSSWIYRDR
jgi:hypothetical protein